MPPQKWVAVDARVQQSRRGRNTYRSLSGEIAHFGADSSANCFVAIQCTEEHVIDIQKTLRRLGGGACRTGAGFWAIVLCTADAEPYRAGHQLRTGGCLPRTARPAESKHPGVRARDLERRHMVACSAHAHQRSKLHTAAHTVRHSAYHAGGTSLCVCRAFFFGGFCADKELWAQWGEGGCEP